jgi:polyphosphate glucokinase
MAVLGIDIGGTGMKGALVDPITGELVSERFRVPTPQKRNPKSMAKAVGKIVSHFDYKGKVGVGFPTIIKKWILPIQRQLTQVVEKSKCKRNL